MIKIKARIKLLVLLIIPSLIFTGIIVGVSKSYLFDFFYNTQRESLQRVTEKIIQSVELSSDNINKLLLFMEQRVIENTDAKNIDNIIDIMYKTKQSYIKGIVYISKDGDVRGEPNTYWIVNDKEKNMIEQLCKNNPVGITWSSHYYSTIDNQSSFFYDPLSIIIKPIYKDNAFIGVLAFVIDLSQYISSISEYGGDYDITTYLYDVDGQLADKLNIRLDNKILDKPVNSSQKELLTLDSAIKYHKKNNAFYAVSSLKHRPNWSIIIIGNMNKLENQFQPFNQRIVSKILIGFTGIFFIYLFIIFLWFTFPMSKLSKGIIHVAEGDLDYRIDMRRDDEFGVVAGEFNHMSQMIKNLIFELNEANEKKRESDFNTLLSQVNPHFLYNTLNTIDIMVDVSPKKEVHKALEILVSLLKYGLDKKNQLRTIRDEYEYIKNYIQILEIRYEKGFSYEIEDPGELGDIKVLKLLIQPLVENAVFHGLFPLKDRKGILKIRAWLEDDRICIEVYDNGVGIPEELQKVLLKGDYENKNSKSSRIGLINVHERIQLYYGENYGLEITSVLNEGTSIIVRLPVEANEMKA